MLPHLTRDVPGVGGVIKQRPEDFFVQELPAYEASGTGEHLMVEIEKIGIPTFEAIRRLAAAHKVSHRDVGYAGLKDAHAVTRQHLTLPGVSEEAAMTTPVPGVSVLWADRHRNKLKPGHTRGNRFAVKIRAVEPTAVVRLRPVLDRLTKHGMPNYLGEQRFGRRGDNDALGRALLTNDHERVVALLLGDPDPARDEGDRLAAREAFAQGKHDDALALLPRSDRLERGVLERFVKSGAAAAVRSVDAPLRKLWLTALQSRVFNEVVARRIDGLGALLAGDVAYKHENGAPFAVEDAQAEQPRADRFEISPTGPLPGYRMREPQGAAAELEADVQRELNVPPDAWRADGVQSMPGDRRPLRVQPQDATLAAGTDEHGPHITAAFSLPAGSFATVFVRELTKAPVPSPGTPGEG